MRRRFWLEAATTAAGCALLVLTLLSTDWIETVFAVDPDHGSGATEWLVAAMLLILVSCSSWLARRERRRALAATSQI